MFYSVVPSHSRCGSFALATILRLRARLFPLVLMLLPMGCGALIPREATKSASVQTSEHIAANHDLTIRRAVEILPEMALRVPQSGVVTSTELRPSVPQMPATRETLEIRSVSGENSGAAEVAQGNSKDSIPLFVKLIGGAVGVFALTFALGWLWRTIRTTALGQGINAGDKVLGAFIQKLRQRALESVTNEEKARHLSDIAHLESERGKLANT